MRPVFYLVSTLLLLPSFASGHHAGAATYDPTASTEIQGVVTRIFWRNPHVHFEVQVEDAAGNEEQWDVESNSISILSRMGITSDVISIGNRVRIAGWPARRPVNAMFATNMLLPDGPEVLLAPRATALWSDETLGSADAWVSDGGTGDPQRSVSGLFRVWSTNMANPASFPLFKDVIVVEDNYPLTEAARTARENWDPVADNPYLDCSPMGMPRVMGQPYPIEFVDNGDEILLRIELFDIERRIMMNGDSPPTGTGRSAQGHSVGHWEDDTLVVTTTRVNWPYFDQSGVPLSESAEIIEHFTTDDTNGQLLYRISVTDPKTFTEPVALEKYWTWRPGEEIQRFDCTEFE